MLFYITNFTQSVMFILKDRKIFASSSIWECRKFKHHLTGNYSRQNHRNQEENMDQLCKFDQRSARLHLRAID